MNINNEDMAFLVNFIAQDERIALAEKTTEGKRAISIIQRMVKELEQQPKQQQQQRQQPQQKQRPPQQPKQERRPRNSQDENAQYVDEFA